MDNSANDLQSFVQDVQNKVSIAVAIAVIQTKPENLSIKNYVDGLRAKVLNEWQKTRTPDVYEDKFLSLHLKKVAQDVAEVLPDSPTVEAYDPPILAERVGTYRPEKESPTSRTNEETIEEHGQLFHSLVQLKFCVETKKTVPFDSVRNFLSETEQSGDASASMLNYLKLSCPSKFDRSKNLQISSSGEHCKLDSVSTSLFKPVVNSPDTDALIVKSTNSLLSYVKSSVFDTPFESHLRWKGSLLEKTCNILSDSLTDAQCRVTVSSFVETCLDHIWDEDNLDMSNTLEHQLTLLSTLSRNDAVIYIAISNVMCKFEEFSESSSDEPIPSIFHRAEKLPYFLNFSQILFNKLKEIVDKFDTNGGHDLNTGISLSNLWRHMRSAEEASIVRNEVHVKHWREILVKLSLALVEAYPLVNWYLSKALAALDALYEVLKLTHCSRMFSNSV